MMTLSAGGILSVRRADRSILIERGITEATIEARLVALGHGPIVARAVALGALSSRVETLALARAIGLAARIDVGEARQRGLIS